MKIIHFSFFLLYTVFISSIFSSNPCTTVNTLRPLNRAIFASNEEKRPANQTNTALEPVTLSSFIKPEDSIKNVPFFQYFSSFGVTLPICVFANFWKLREDAIVQIVFAFDAYLIFICLPCFLGYLPSFDPKLCPGDIISPRFSFLKFTPVEFPDSNLVVSIRQWRAIFVYWFLEILLLMPPNYFKQIESFIGMEIRQHTEEVFIVLSLYVFGILAMFDNFIESYYKSKVGTWKKSYQLIQNGLDDNKLF